MGFPCWRGPGKLLLLAWMISVLPARSSQPPSEERTWGSAKVQLHSKKDQQVTGLLRKLAKGGREKKKKKERNGQFTGENVLEYTKNSQHTSAFNI